MTSFRVPQSDTSSANLSPISSGDKNAVEKVTMDKPKNPGRQAWGRQLGKMQKERKAKKLSDLGEMEQAKLPLASSISDRCQVEPSFLKWEYLIAGTGIIIGIVALYYQKKSYEVDVAKADVDVKLVEKKNEEKKNQILDF